jgi:hypothetical protein
MYNAYKNRNVYDLTSIPALAFGQACDSEKKPPLPVISHSQETSLVLNRYNLDKGISSALAKAIPVMPSLQSIHLDENGLTDSAGAEILKGIASHGSISSFFYTHNDIGPVFIKEFESLIRTCPISELNFNGCKLKGQNLIDFIWSLRLCRGLKKLSLSGLSLSYISVEKLSKIMVRSKLVYLDLSWNQIPQEASLIFFSKLTQNNHLKFLDYSWNPLTDLDQTEAVCKVISLHPVLMHLNLSYTQISDISFYIQAIYQSKHLISLHLTGNTIQESCLPSKVLPKLYPNSANYFEMPTKCLNRFYNLKHRDKNGRRLETHIDNIINIESPKKNTDKHNILETKEVILTRVIGQSDLKGSEDWGVSKHCWVCERWGIYHLKVTLSSLQTVATPDIFHSRSITGCKLVLKPSFNNWKDVEFEVLDEGKGEYDLSILIPPGKHRFWIILDDQSVCVTRKISTARWNKILVNQFIMPLRELEISLTGEMSHITQPIFDKNKSVFRNFLEDSETVLKAAFESDLKCMKINRIVREYHELDQVVDILRKNYPKIKSIFFELIIGKNYPYIDKEGFIGFCNTCEILDSYSNLERLESIFYFTNVEVVSHEKNPDNKLCRYEFLEILVRLALSKFHDLDAQYSTKLQKLLDDHVYKFSFFSKAARFRKEKLYNIDVNEILERNIGGLQNLMNKYKENSGRYISIKGAGELLQSVDWKLDEHQLLRLFANSKMAIIDEMSSENSYEKLEFIEMIELICRVIDFIRKEDTTLDQKLLLSLPILLESNKIRYVNKLISANTDETL